MYLLWFPPSQIYAIFYDIDAYKKTFTFVLEVFDKIICQFISQFQKRFCRKYNINLKPKVMYYWLGARRALSLYH